MIEVPTNDLKILFDALVTSMDFGSGFLDTEEVEALRNVAVLLGVDPTDATPTEFAAQHPHGVRQRTSSWPPSDDLCGHCHRAVDDPIHQPTPQKDQT